MQSLLVLFTVACSLVMLEAAYLRNGETKDNEAAVQQPVGDVRIPYFLDQYSPGKPLNYYKITHPNYSFQK